MSRRYSGTRQAQFITFLRAFVFSHKYEEGSMGQALVDHQNSLGNLTVKEAIDSINQFTEINEEICCLYSAVAFWERFGKSFVNIRLAFSPEENPLYSKPNRRSSKVVIVVDDMVYDIISMIGHQDDFTGYDKVFSLYHEYCEIPIDDYCSKHLLDGENLTVLPNIFGSENMNFIQFFFNNPMAEIYTGKVA